MLPVNNGYDLCLVSWIARNKQSSLVFNYNAFIYYAYQIIKFSTSEDFVRGCSYQLKIKHIYSVMVSMFVLSVVDCGFEPQLGQTKDYEIDI